MTISELVSSIVKQAQIIELQMEDTAEFGEVTDELSKINRELEDLLKKIVFTY